MGKSETLLLGITGSVAAFKGVELASALTQKNWRVLTVLTEGGRKFIQPLSFSSVTQEPVLTYEEPPDPSCPLNHVTAAQEAKVLAIAPATANTIAKIAHGIADNFLTLSVLAFKGPVLIAPAMNCRMYESAPVQENIRNLKQRGVVFIGPAEGRLACGESGQGRFPPISEIVEAIDNISAKGS